MMLRRPTRPSPPSPALRKDRGVDESPRHSTPADDTLRTEDRTLAEYIPYRSPKTTVATPLASAIALPTRDLLPPLGASSVATWWNPVTGFHELLSRRASSSSSLDIKDGSNHDEIAELPGSTPASAPHQRMELETAASPPPRRSAPSPTAVATRSSTSKLTVSNGEDDHEEKEDHHDHRERLGPDQTGDTKSTTTDDADPAGVGLSSVRHLRELEGTLRTGILRLLLDEHQNLDRYWDRMQRGRDEALGELWQALRTRAAARHVGVAEARILRREADAIYRMIERGQEPEEGWDSKRERALEDVLKMVQEIAVRVCTAAGAVEAAFGNRAVGECDARASPAVDDVAPSDLRVN